MKPLRFIQMCNLAGCGLVSVLCSLPLAARTEWLSSVTFDNKSGKVALVKLVGPSAQAVEVPDGQSRKVKTPTGRYYILVRYGSPPDRYGYSKGEPFDVEEKETATGTEYSETTITLHPVVGGNYSTEPSSKDEFEKAAGEVTSLPANVGVLEPNLLTARKVQLIDPNFLTARKVQLIDPNFMVVSVFQSIKIPESEAGTVRPTFGGNKRGGLEGRVVWADNSGVEKAEVKIADKLEVFKTKTELQLFPVQQIAISRDANVVDTKTDEQGRFKFDQLPPGKYFVFFKVAGWFEGDDWIYQYHKPLNVYYLAGYMPRPDEYSVKADEITKLADIKVIKRLEAAPPSKLPDKDGYYSFSWSKYEIEGVFHLSVEHLDYSGNLQHPEYRAQQIKDPSYSNGEALFPGRHRFQVEQRIGKALSVYARSRWIEFTVSGDVLKLAVDRDDHDPTGRTISWRGSEAIKAVDVNATDGSYHALIRNQAVELPAASGKRFELRACDEKGKELIPGWRVFYWQPRSKESK